MFTQTTRRTVPLLAALALSFAQSAMATPLNAPPVHKLEGYSGYELPPVAIGALCRRLRRRQLHQHKGAYYRAALREIHCRAGVLPPHAREA